MHHDRIGRRLARRLDQPDLRHRVHRDVGQRIGLPAHVAGLRGQVEDHRGALAQRAQVELADVAAHQFHRRIRQVRRVGAAAEQEPVQRRDARAALRQRMAEIGAEESGAAGDQYLASVPAHHCSPVSAINDRREHGETLSAVQSRSRGGPRRSPPALRMISLKPNSSISTPDSTSMPVIARTSSEAGAMSPNPSVVIVATL